MTSSKNAKVVRDRTDWARLRAMSEEDIEQMAADDEDNPATVNSNEWAHATVGLPASKTSQAYPKACAVHQPRQP